MQFRVTITTNFGANMLHKRKLLKWSERSWEVFTFYRGYCVSNYNM
jgi:hypothetical protein